MTARLERLGPEVAVEGVRASESWRVRIPLAGGSDQPGVGVLFGRNKIASLMQGKTRGADPSGVRRAVIRVALEHRLVSKYTSLVAVDVTPTRPDGLNSVPRAVPVNLPAGWEYEKVFGPAPATATPASMHLIAGALLLALGGIMGMRGRFKWRRGA